MGSVVFGRTRRDLMGVIRTTGITTARSSWWPDARDWETPASAASVKYTPQRRWRSALSYTRTASGRSYIIKLAKRAYCSQLVCVRVCVFLCVLRDVIHGYMEGGSGGGGGLPCF